MLRKSIRGTAGVTPPEWCTVNRTETEVRACLQRLFKCVPSQVKIQGEWPFRECTEPAGQAWGKMDCTESLTCGSVAQNGWWLGGRWLVLRPKAVWLPAFAFQGAISAVLRLHCQLEFLIKWKKDNVEEKTTQIWHDNGLVLLSAQEKFQKNLEEFVFLVSIHSIYVHVGFSSLPCLM